MAKRTKINFIFCAWLACLTPNHTFAQLDQSNPTAVFISAQDLVLRGRYSDALVTIYNDYFRGKIGDDHYSESERPKEAHEAIVDFMKSQDVDFEFALNSMNYSNILAQDCKYTESEELYAGVVAWVSRNILRLHDSERRELQKSMIAGRWISFLKREASIDAIEGEEIFSNYDDRQWWSLLASGSYFHNEGKYRKAKNIIIKLKNESRSEIQLIHAELLELILLERVLYGSFDTNSFYQAIGALENLATRASRELGSDSPLMSAILQLRGNFLALNNQFDEFVEQTLLSIELDARIARKNCVETAVKLFSIAKVLDSAGFQEEAVDLYMRSLGVAEHSDSVEFSFTRDIARHLAYIYKSKRGYERNLEIIEKRYGEQIGRSDPFGE